MLLRGVCCGFPGQGMASFRSMGSVGRLMQNMGRKGARVALQGCSSTNTRSLSSARLGELGGGCVQLQQPKPDMAVLSLCNKGRRNAMTGKMMVDLEACIDKLEKSEVACVVVHGDGNFFCSGSDLSLVSGAVDDASIGHEMCTFMTDLLTRLRSIPAVSIAAINGGAVGGGAELATACDLRVFASDAYIQFVHARMGLSPGWGGAGRLTSIVGRRHALRLLCGGDRLTASDAEQIGLSDYIGAAGEDALDAAVRVLSNWNTHPSVMRGCKKAVHAADPLPEGANEAATNAFGEVWGSPFNRAAVSKVMQKKSC